MVDKIFNNVFDTLEKSLDIRTKRQALIASNIVNQDTPGYRAKDIDFRKALNAAMRNSDTQHIQLITTDGNHIPIDSDSEGIEIEAADSKSIGNDGNTVNIDSEIQKMQKNSGMYQITMEMLKYKFKSIKNILDNEK